ncbi:MAG TPA: protein-L-isoaspartate O-methyltransferase [Gammaproteobacteria bacterium]|nr:protein-L-isoaspartate O-methyltransferase [Gammaproteobacteria bacterium]
MNFEKARYNMVEQQIRTWTVLDNHVLDVMEQLPREHFVPEKYKQMAYADLAIPLDHNQVMMPPKIEAHALQALNIQPEDNILEIGTGSGYLTALLATLGSHVDSVDIYSDFQKAAAEKLTSLAIDNVSMIEGDASQGWGKPKQYDAIVITAALPELPEQYKQALAIGGRLFAVLGEGIVMQAVLVHRTHGDEWEQKSLFETALPLLINSEKPQAFVF